MQISLLVCHSAGLIRPALDLGLALPCLRPTSLAEPAEALVSIELDKRLLFTQSVRESVKRFVHEDEF